MEETYSKWPEWQKVYVYIKILPPRGCLPLPRGYIHVYKHEKLCIKSDFKDIFLKLATNGQSDKAFPHVYSPGTGADNPLWTKSWCQQKSLVTLNGQSDKGFLLTSTFVPKELSAPALGLYTCIKALKYIPGPGVRWAFTGPTVLWFIFAFQTTEMHILAVIMLHQHKFGVYKGKRKLK